MGVTEKGDRTLIDQSKTIQKQGSKNQHRPCCSRDRKRGTVIGLRKGMREEVIGESDASHLKLFSILKLNLR